jgi:hypothetical protein
MSGKKESDKKVALVFVVNGQMVPVESSMNAPVKAAVQRALAASDNTGRSPDEWETRDPNGVLVETDRKVGELGLRDGSQLFLSLRVGAGG